MPSHLTENVLPPATCYGTANPMTSGVTLTHVHNGIEVPDLNDENCEDEDENLHSPCIYPLSFEFLHTQARYGDPRSRDIPPFHDSAIPRSIVGKFETGPD